jgi:hypothetical protein
VSTPGDATDADGGLKQHMAAAMPGNSAAGPRFSLGPPASIA